MSSNSRDNSNSKPAKGKRGLQNNNLQSASQAENNTKVWLDAGESNIKRVEQAVSGLLESKITKVKNNNVVIGLTNCPASASNNAILDRMSQVDIIDSGFRFARYSADQSNRTHVDGLAKKEFDAQKEEMINFLRLLQTLSARVFMMQGVHGALLPFVDLTAQAKFATKLQAYDHPLLRVSIGYITQTHLEVSRTMKRFAAECESMTIERALILTFFCPDSPFGVDDEFRDSDLLHIAPHLYCPMEVIYAACGLMVHEMIDDKAFMAAHVLSKFLGRLGATSDDNGYYRIRDLFTAVKRIRSTNSTTAGDVADDESVRSGSVAAGQADMKASARGQPSGVCGVLRLGADGTLTSGTANGANRTVAEAARERIGVGELRHQAISELVKLIQSDRRCTMEFEDISDAIARLQALLIPKKFTEVSDEERPYAEAVRRAQTAFEQAVLFRNSVQTMRQEDVMLSTDLIRAANEAYRVSNERLLQARRDMNRFIAQRTQNTDFFQAWARVNSFVKDEREMHVMQIEDNPDGTVDVLLHECLWKDADSPDDVLFSILNDIASECITTPMVFATGAPVSFMPGFMRRELVVPKHSRVLAADESRSSRSEEQSMSSAARTAESPLRGNELILDDNAQAAPVDIIESFKPKKLEPNPVYLYWDATRQLSLPHSKSCQRLDVAENKDLDAVACASHLGSLGIIVSDVPGGIWRDARLMADFSLDTADRYHRDSIGNASMPQRIISVHPVVQTLMLFREEMDRASNESTLDLSFFLKNVTMEQFNDVFVETKKVIDFSTRQRTGIYEHDPAEFSVMLKEILSGVALKKPKAKHELKMVSRYIDKFVFGDAVINYALEFSYPVRRFRRNIYAQIENNRLEISPLQVHAPRRPAVSSSSARAVENPLPSVRSSSAASSSSSSDAAAAAVSAAAAASATAVSNGFFDRSFDDSQDSVSIDGLEALGLSPVSSLPSSPQTKRRRLRKGRFKESKRVRLSDESEDSREIAALPPCPEDE